MPGVPTVRELTAKIKDEHRALSAGAGLALALLVGLLLAQAVRDGRGRGLVDDAEHIQTGDLAGVLCRVTLGVVEVCGDRNHGVLDLLNGAPQKDARKSGDVSSLPNK